MSKSKPKPSLPYLSDITAAGMKKNLTMRELLMLYILRSGMHKGNTKNWRSQKTLALEMRCSRTLVNQTVKDLEEKGLIAVRRTEGKSCCYELKIPRTCSKSEKGCSESKQVPVQNLNKGYSASKHEGVQNLNPNALSIIDQRNISKGNSSSSIADDDEQSADNYSYSDFQKNDTSNSSGHVRKGIQRFAVREKEINQLLESRGKGFAEQAHDFADEIIKKVKPDHPLPYKLAVLETILRGGRADFKPLSEEELERFNASMVTIEIEDKSESPAEIKVRKSEEERIHRLKKLYEKLTKGDHIIYDCMVQAGLSYDSGKLNIEGFTEFLKECKANRKINGGKLSHKDLRKAILTEAGL
jgi:hypothetical protein